MSSRTTSRGILNSRIEWAHIKQGESVVNNTDLAEVDVMAGILYAIHLAMKNIAAPLHPPVVTQRGDASVEKESAADRNAALAKTLQRLHVRRLDPMRISTSVIG